ncbi:hypothetical protein [Photobacterium sp. TY1-4]|uniref:hypothetical protein n=1 Tax=Photobacterium sp. TY1-4 TaxID=2899122 RepID=UPI0021C12E22|nr:hypothetical protein [Photobacterium sp. TY1-4]UXI04666.1 hypothetical protein NH461_25465 [Photobacterium sp. TY1-4]
MDYEAFELGLKLLLGVISVIVLIYYYSSTKHSSCYFCRKTISHKKQNRYYLNEDDDRHAICKACYGKKMKEISAPKVYCYCCNKIITKRMKSHLWVLNSGEFTLCSTCNRIGSKKLKFSIDIEDLISDDFLSRNSSFTRHSDLFESANLPLSSETDLESDEWKLYISKHTKFDSWHELKSAATEDQRESRIRDVLNEISTPSK